MLKRIVLAGALTTGVAACTFFGFGSDDLRPLPVARAPFEKVGAARQDALLLNSKYKPWTFGAFREWAEFKFGDKSVMAAGEDQRMRLSGGYGFGADRTCGFGYVGVYDGKLAAEQSGKYLVWAVRLLCPGEVADRNYASTNDTLKVTRGDMTIAWTRRSNGKDYSYELKATGPGRVELAYDAGLAVTVEQRIKDDNHGIVVTETKPQGGGRGRISIDVGESALPREKARPMNTGIDFWANDAYDVPVRPTKNLLVNGGFEQGLRNWNNSTVNNWQQGWETIRDKQGGSNLISVVRSSRSGNWALAFGVSNCENVVSAPLAIVPGRTYVVSYYARKLDPSVKDSHSNVYYQKPGGHSWTDTFQYDQQAKCVNAPDGKTADANGWVRHARAIRAIRGPGVLVGLSGKNVLIDDVQVEEGDSVTDFTTDPVNARILTDTKWRFFRPGQKVNARVEVGGEKGVKGKVKVEVMDIFSSTVLAREYDVDFADATLKEHPIDLSAAIAQPGMYFVRYSFDAKGLTWRDYSRFEVAEPLRNEHPTHKLYSNFWFDRSSLAEDQVARMVALGWGAANYHGLSFVNGPTAHLYRKYNIAPMLHCAGDETLGKQCPHYEAAKKAGLGVRHDVMKFCRALKIDQDVLAYLREVAYLEAKNCREDDVYWSFLGEEDELGKTEKVADVYAHYQKAVHDGLKKGFDERGIRFYFSPTAGTTGGSIDHGIPTLEQYIKSGKKIGLTYDFVCVHMAWSIDEASVASYSDRETNHADIKEMLARNGMGDAPFMQPETFYLLQQYIPEWDSIDWCDNYGGGLPSQALGNREFLQAALLCRTFLIDLESWPRALSSHPWQRPFTLDREMTTYSWSHVPSALCHLLPDPKFLGRKKLNPVIRTLGFEQSGHGVSTIWSTDHDIERGTKSCHVVKAKLPAGTRFYDMMGAERSAKVADGVTELPITCAPIFLVADDAEGLWAAVQAAEPPKYERVVSERYFPNPQIVWKTPKCGAKPDWSKIEAIPDHPEQRMNWKGKVKVAWNGEALFIRAESKHPMMRIGFDGIGNARRALLEGLGPDDQVYDFRGRDIFRIKETNTQFAHGSIRKPGEDEMRRDFGRTFTPAADGKGGVWELRITPRFLSPIELKDGFRAGFRFDFAEEPVNLELGDPVDWIMLELVTDDKAAK